MPYDTGGALPVQAWNSSPVKKRFFSVYFAGSGVDEEDGELAGPSLTWSSDKDGVPGTGRSFSRSHPFVRGSYLTACVFYSILFLEDSNHEIMVTIEVFAW